VGANQQDNEALAATEPPLRKIGVIGDVHGESHALEYAVRFLLGLPGLDALLCTGDIPAKRGVGDTDACCRLLSQYGVLPVRGNHDRWFVENSAADALPFSTEDEVLTESALFLRSLPACRLFETPRGPLLLCHGLGEDDECRIFPDDDEACVLEQVRADPIVCAGSPAIIVSGHTHVPMLRPLPGDAPVLINAGTLHWGYDCGFVVCDLEAGTVRFYSLDHERACAITPRPVHCLPVRGSGKP